MSRARRKVSNKRRERQTVKLTQRQIQEQFARQRQAAKERQQRKQAIAARTSYKPRKKDRGKLILIGVKGQKDPQNKGRRGYLLYVTKTGKKWLVKQTGNKGQYQARKLRDIAPPARRNLRRAAKNFEAARLEKVSQHRAAVKGSGNVKIKPGAYDFNDKVVAKIAKSLKHIIERQASKRSFLITAMVLVKLPDGSTETFQVQLPIDKADHISIKLGGLINFVRQKFYAFMARELAFKGYVTSGSANHIRRLADNQDAEPGEYVDKLGKHWQGNDMDIVKILTIDWKLEQAK